MTCRRCRKKIEEFETRCPHCGDVNEKAAGTFQTSTVLISANGADQVYRSVEEVPAGLRELAERKILGKAVVVMDGAA